MGTKITLTLEIFREINLQHGLLRKYVHMSLISRNFCERKIPKLPHCAVSTRWISEVPHQRQSSWETKKSLKVFTFFRQILDHEKYLSIFYDFTFWSN